MVIDWSIELDNGFYSWGVLKGAVLKTLRYPIAGNGK